MRPVLVRRLASSCVVLAAASVAVGSVAHPGPSATVAADQRPELTDDDGGEALFDVPALAPGRRVERCIRITRDDGLGRVALHADPHGPLAAGVTLAVARGEGGAFGDCAHFSGTVVYRGTLADAATGLDDAAWDGSGAGRATYRFVLRAPADLSPDAGRARVAFRWTAEAAHGVQDAGGSDGAGGTDDGGPTGTVAPASTAVADAAPPSSATGTAGSGVGAPGTRQRRHASGRDRPERTKHKAGAARPADGDPPARAGGSRPSGLGETLRRLAAAVAHAAVEGAKRVAFPILLLIAMALFALFQNRLDRRDPKLALAPVHASPDLAFSDPDADGGRRS